MLKRGICERNMTYHVFFFFFSGRASELDSNRLVIGRSKVQFLLIELGFSFSEDACVTD